MLATQLTALAGATPPGVDDAADLVSAVDGVLAYGLARLDDERSSALSAFAGAFVGTPLGDLTADAVAKIAAGSIGDEHLAALAGGRAALLGAVHDALLGQLDTALGRTREAWRGAGPAPCA